MSKNLAMLFGYYLVERGLISMEDVLEALDKQREHMLPIGQLATREGKLSEKQVYEVLEAQQSSRLPFGAIAVELGFLSKSEVTGLLHLQMNSWPDIGDILVKMGVIEKDKVVNEMSLYEEKATLSLARRAGVSTAAPYRHFDSLEGLLSSVAKDGFDALGKQLQDAFSTFPDSPIRRFQETGIAYVAFAFENPAYFRLMFSSLFVDKSAYPELLAAAKKATLSTGAWRYERAKR